MERLAIVLAMTASLVLVAPASNGDGAPVTFAGTCELSGEVNFDPPLGRSIVQTTSAAALSGDCSGALTGADGAERRITDAETTYRARASGPASCAGGTPTGEGHLVIDEERIDFLFAERRATAVALITLTGVDGGTAAVVGRSSPDTDVVDTLLKCTRDVLSPVAVDFTLLTTSISG